MSRPPLEVAEAVLAATDGDEARVMAVHERAGLTRFAESHIHQHVGEDATTVHLTLVRDGRVASVSTTDSTEAGLRRLVDRARALADAAPVDDEWPGLATPAAADDPGHVDPSTVEATGEDRARVVQDFVRAGGANAAGFCDTADTTLAVADSAGGRHQQRMTRATIDGIHRLDGGVAGSAHQTSTALSDLDGASAGTRARRLADLGTVETMLSPGRYEVVLGPEAVATISIFLGFYGFNGKSHNEGQSGIRLGAAQFDASLDLVDDPFGDRSIGLGFDTEGTLRRRVELVLGGVSTELAHDRRTAAKAGTTSTGHGHPESAAYGPITSNVQLSPSPDVTAVPVAELAAGMERGLLVTAFNYCRVIDPKSISVTGLTRNGTFLVEDGHIVGSAGNVRFTQSFLDAVGPESVLAWGDDTRMADSEFGVGMASVPSMRLRSWNITGNAKG